MGGVVVVVVEEREDVEMWLECGSRLGETLLDGCHPRGNIEGNITERGERASERWVSSGGCSVVVFVKERGCSVSQR